MRNKSTRFSLFPGIILFLCLAITGLFLFHSPGRHRQDTLPTIPGQRLEISFITIGKGDAFVLKMPDNSYYMYDTGKKEDWEQIEAVLDGKQISSLKGIFLSHGHKDHAGNLKKLLKKMPVEKIYLSEKDTVSFDEDDLEEVLLQWGENKIVRLNGGETLELGGATASIWIPERCDYENENNNSLILHLSYGETSCLFTGDMEYEEEAAFLSSGFPCQATILKLGHHGEKDATSLALLQRVKPEYALITGNQKENPASVNKEIQARLDACHIEPFYSEGEWLAWDFSMDGTETIITKYGEE